MVNAEEVTRRAIERSVRAGRDLDAARSRLSLASILKAGNDLEGASAEAELALKVFCHVGARANESAANLLLGYIYSDLGRTTDATVALARASQLAEELNIGEWARAAQARLGED